jgi:hypothetical protein
LTKLLSQEVFGKHVNTMGVRIFELSFWTSGRCWNYVCPATIFKVIWNYLIFGIPHYGNYMYLYMELVYIFTMELLLVGIYLSVKSLRKPVDYQWNTIYSYWKDYPGTLIIGRN